MAKQPLLCFKSELAIITQEALKYGDIETGGDLFGYWTHTGSPVIHYAIGPGPNAEHNPASFYQDAEFLERKGAELNDRFGLQHVGEWHSHHRLSLAKPSGGDIRTVERALAHHGFSRFALLICNLSHGNRHAQQSSFKVSVGAFAFNAGASEPSESPWIVFPESSPVRVVHGPPVSYGSVPECELLPGVITMNDLRHPQKQAAPIESEATGWFSTADGKKRLHKECDAFTRQGVDAKVFLTDDDRIIITVSKGEILIHFHLPLDFPDNGPEVFIRRGSASPARLEVSGVAWTRMMLVADIYSALPRKLTTDTGRPEPGELEATDQKTEKPAVETKRRHFLGLFL